MSAIIRYACKKIIECIDCYRSHKLLFGLNLPEKDLMDLCFIYVILLYGES